jgi:hypothetical protein
MTRAQLREWPSQRSLPHERGVPAQAALVAPEVLSLSNLLQELVRRAMLNEKRVVDSEEWQSTLTLCQDVHDKRIIEVKTNHTTVESEFEETTLLVILGGRR